MGKIAERFRTGNTHNVTKHGALQSALSPTGSNPDPKLKGVFGKNCNVTACQEPGATWWNKVMRKYYCPYCARQINYAPLDDGTYLCSPGNGTELSQESYY